MCEDAHTRAHTVIAWKGVSPALYRTTTGGAEAHLFEDGWYARLGRRWRGPHSDMLRAMDGAEELLQRAAREASPPAK